MLKEDIQARLFRDGKFIDRSVRHIDEDLRSRIMACGPTNASISEAIFWVVNDLSYYPKLCRCGQPITKFISFNQGYIHDFCSSKCSNSSLEVQELKKEVSRQKYGTDFPWQTPDIKKKIAQQQSLRNFSKLPTITEEVEKQNFRFLKWDNSIMSNPARLICSEGHEFDRQLEGWNRWNITCPKCSRSRSRGEVEVENFIESLGFSVLTTGKKKLLSSDRPLEIDIFVPSMRFGVEYNGMFYHSSVERNDRGNKIRHFEKQQLAEEQGIRLIQIWESEWQEKQEIVKSRLASALGRSTRIYARTCQIVEVDHKTASNFLSDNHIQGSCIASVNLGLKHEGVLVALMTFSKPRFSKKTEWELLRFCNVVGYSVIGGASRLFRAFTERHKPNSVLSYADRRWSQGNLYKQLGFIEEGKPTPGYWYWKQGEGLCHRMAFQKHRLDKKLAYFNSNLTEEENVFQNGYRVIWDCGNLTYIWRK